MIIHFKKNSEGCTQKELAEKMQVKPSTLNVNDWTNGKEWNI